MKTYVITLSKVFPKGHPKQGEPTGFEEAILNAINGIDRAGHKKIHTIRANYGLWLKRFMDIEAGNAILSIRQWTGAPYRSKQREIAWLSKEDGIGIQRLQLVDLFRATTIEGRKIELPDLARNDGLTFDDWYQWFKGYDLNKPLAIIHFTKFRYK